MMDDTNIIANTAIIPDFVKIGKFNRIGNNVIIQAIRGAKTPSLTIGDCNIINDNVKILVGDNGVYIKDWNVIHNDILIIGEDKIEIGHNCWFGQNTILDGSGTLIIKNGVRVGMYSQIWTHVASGEQIEGCILYAKRQTIIEDNVWLVGSCVVGSGIILGQRSTYLINSVVTKDSEANRVYSGAPAKIMEKANFYKNVSLEDKFDMMQGWASDYADENSGVEVRRSNANEIEIFSSNEKLIFKNLTDDYEVDNPLVTIFNMSGKTFFKKYTALERAFYSYIYNNKARFTPIN